MKPEGGTRPVVLKLEHGADPEGLLKHRLLGPTQSFSDSVGPGKDVYQMHLICIYCASPICSPVVLMLLVQRKHSENHWAKSIICQLSLIGDVSLKQCVRLEGLTMSAMGRVSQEKCHIYTLSWPNDPRGLLKPIGQV